MGNKMQSMYGVLRVELAERVDLMMMMSERLDMQSWYDARLAELRHALWIIKSSDYWGDQEACGLGGALRSLVMMMIALLTRINNNQKERSRSVSLGAWLSLLA
ncbi:hypothetical protein MGYG_01201 [Nannizzia gypsea CBS 118893]|uniref:Uncharacterized protein n=1 Tax=Arthroderma gypseum (strain ATCC MYA-4604 / CBS 118893) TaxID=535722 RepID=E5QZE7_ARTGP|nr:hypothetical protein MGYG_01201 [Nannizzia gypsea CBS 118893]EFQ98165.1 hypothetical protein MGYG_01201 [Nannizzia gypsea CBS 118893]